MVTQIAKWGHSLAVRIPKPFAREARLEEGTEVDITVSGGRLVISPRERQYDFDRLVRRITPENRHDETDWGEAVGREAW